MERLSSAILEKVSANAKAIVKEAEERAEQRIKAAQGQQRVKFEEQKSKLLNEANAEAIKILAQAAIRARLETLAAKTVVVNEIIEKANNQLAGLAGNERVLAGLTKEGIALLGADMVRVYVAAKDMAAMQKLVKEDKDFAKRVVEVKRQDSLGGVIVEDMEGKNRIDNTFDSRREMLLPKLLPQIEKELF